MELNAYLSDVKSDEVETIAGFGDAKLVRTIDLKYELRGGSHEDRLAAREWVSLFFNEAVVREV
jgi:hypothetical protein